MNPKLKSYAYGIGALILGLSTLIAEAPPELQKQLPQLFPERARGYLVLIFATAAYISHRYSASHATAAAIANAPASNVSTATVSVSTSGPTNSLMSRPPVQGPNIVKP